MKGFNNYCMLVLVPLLIVMYHIFGIFSSFIVSDSPSIAFFSSYDLYSDQIIHVFLWNLR